MAITKHSHKITGLMLYLFDKSYVYFTKNFHTPHTHLQLQE